MGAVRSAILAAALLLWSTPAGADTPDPVLRWRPYIAEASLRFGVPQRWIERVMRIESGGMTALNGRPIRSRVGAIGLMQLMPSTWAAMRAWLHLGESPDDPHDNIIAGTAYLRLMYDRFGYPGLFAAYNAGPARYANHLRTGRPLPGETIAYLGQVAGSQDTPKLVASRPKSSGIFFQIDSVSRAIPAENSPPPTLFVPLKRAGDPH